MGNDGNEENRDSCHKTKKNDENIENSTKKSKKMGKLPLETIGIRVRSMCQVRGDDGETIGKRSDRRKVLEASKVGKPT